MDELVINIYNVKHGNCVHIITPNGRQILVDVGTREDKSIVGYIKERYFLGVKNPQMDCFILTHTHEDHMNDLPNLMEYVPPFAINRPREAFYLQKVLGNDRYNKLVDSANSMHENYGYSVLESENPLNPQNNGGVEVEVYRDANLYRDDDPNYYSCIIVIKYQQYKFVLTGDNPKDQLDTLIENDEDNICEEISNATVLMAPHHGRTEEYCENFVKLVNPEIVVVSDGTIKCDTQKNTAAFYGRYSRGIVTNSGIRKVLTTRNDGNITIKVWHDARLNDQYNCWICNNEEDY